MTMTHKTVRATCACDQLTVIGKGPPTLVSVCHCQACQRRTGSAFGIAVFFRKQDILVCGEATRFQRDADNGAQVSFWFCPRCGATVYWVTSRKPDKIAVAGGAFGANDWLIPSQSVNENNKLPWVTLDDCPAQQQ